MRIILACDGYGAPLAEAVAQHLRATRPDIALEDRGNRSKYYEAAHQVAGEVEAAAAAGRTDVRAVLCCGSGQVCLWTEGGRELASQFCPCPCDSPLRQAEAACAGAFAETSAAEDSPLKKRQPHH